MFTGFPEETIRFFLELRLHNDVSYFNQRRSDFEKQVQAPFFGFIEALGPTMQSIDNNMEVRPAKCLSRIRRDTRFTKDKAPYRDHLWLLFKRAAEPKDQSVMYWFELGPDSIDWGLGFWGENRPAMDILRRNMLAKPRAFINIIKSCNLEAHDLVLDGDNYKRMSTPENLPEVLMPWYTKKQLFIMKRGATVPMAFDKNIINTVAEDYLALKPMYLALRGAVEEMQEAQENQ